MFVLVHEKSSHILVQVGGAMMHMVPLTRRSCTSTNNFTFIHHPHKLIIKKCTVMVLILFQSHGSFGPPNWCNIDTNPFMGLYTVYYCTIHNFLVQLQIACLCVISKWLRRVQRTHAGFTLGFGDRRATTKTNFIGIRSYMLQNCSAFVLYIFEASITLFLINFIKFLL